MLVIPASHLTAPSLVLALQLADQRLGRLDGLLSFVQLDLELGRLRGGLLKLATEAGHLAIHLVQSFAQLLHARLSLLQIPGVNQAVN